VARIRSDINSRLGNQPARRRRNSAPAALGALDAHDAPSHLPAFPTVQLAAFSEALSSKSDINDAFLAYHHGPADDLAEFLPDDEDRMRMNSPADVDSLTRAVAAQNIDGEDYGGNWDPDASVDDDDDELDYGGGVYGDY
jgi:hypothetical protein